MQEEIHPEYKEATITCGCGESFQTKTTKGDLRVEICSNCHPFYTRAKQGQATRGGQVEKFKEKYGMEE